MFIPIPNSVSPCPPEPVCVETRPVPDAACRPATFGAAALRALVGWEQRLARPIHRDHPRGEELRKLAAAATSALSGNRSGSFTLEAGLVIDESGAGEEFFQNARRWSLTVSHGKITLKQWINRATQVSASQHTEMEFTGIGDDPLPDGARDWLSSLEAALAGSRCFSSGFSKQE